MNRASEWLVKSLCLGVLAISLGGCVGPGELAAFREEAAALHAALKADEAAWEERVANMNPDDPLRPRAEAELGAARASRSAVEAAVGHVDLALSMGNNAPEGWWVPEPLRTPLLLGAALAASLMRARQLKLAIGSVARGLEKAMQEDDVFRDRFREHANTFRTVQTPAAKRAVDEAVKPGLMLRLPI